MIRERIEKSNGILDNPTLLAILFLPALEVGTFCSTGAISHVSMQN